MHAGGGDRDPNSGSADDRGQVDLKISKSFTPAEKQRIKSLGRTIDEALRRSRAGKVDTEMLKDLGMTAEQFAGFVKRYTDRFDKIRKKTDDKPPLPKDIVRNAFDQTGSKKVQEGRSTDKRLGDTSGMSDLTPDQIRKLYESRKAKVSPEYRKHVEAYLRAISENAPTEE